MPINMKDANNKRISDIVNSKFGIGLLLVNGVCLFLVAIYALRQHEQKTGLQIVCGIITLVFSLVIIITNVLKGYRLLK